MRFLSQNLQLIGVRKFLGLSGEEDNMSGHTLSMSKLSGQLETYMKSVTKVQWVHISWQLESLLCSHGVQHCFDVSVDNVDDEQSDTLQTL